MASYNGLNDDEAQVLVVDADSQFVESVSPAIARRALKDGFVELHCKDPFSIRLHRGMNHCPLVFSESRRAKKDGYSLMSIGAKIDFTEIFREECELWIKALVPGQVSLQFELSPGREHGILIPATGDPICLTDQVPFDAIKRSTDIRKLSNPRRMQNGGIKPAAIQLMTPDDVEEYFRKKAIRKGMFKKNPMGETMTDALTGDPIPDIEAVSAPKITEPMQTASAKRIETVKSKSEELMDQHSDNANLGNKPVMLAEIINPKVLHLCQQVQTAETDKDRPLADTMIDEFESLGSLNDDSLSYILSFGHYKSVKKWATEQLSSRNVAEEE